ncbi:hypothetical protein D3C86_1258350 [compost metagenome]
MGDLIDGNPQVFECVEELLKIKNLISIKGNHDAWFLQFLETDYHPQVWNHGGITTLESYLMHCQPYGKIIKSGSGYKTSLNSKNIPESHKTFFKKQLLYFVDSHNRCFVHAGFDRNKPIKGQKEQNYYLDRSLWFDALGLKNNITNQLYFTIFNKVYIGHTATTRWNTTFPMSAFEVMNVDTGAGYNGKLTILDIKSGQYWQSDTI